MAKGCGCVRKRPQQARGSIQSTVVRRDERGAEGRARSRRADISQGVVAAAPRRQSQVAAVDAGATEEIWATDSRLCDARLPGTVDGGRISGQHQRLVQLVRRLLDLRFTPGDCDAQS